MGVFECIQYEFDHALIFICNDQASWIWGPHLKMQMTHTRQATFHSELLRHIDTIRIPHNHDCKRCGSTSWRKRAVSKRLIEIQILHFNTSKQVTTSFRRHMGHTIKRDPGQSSPIRNCDTCRKHKLQGQQQATRVAKNSHAHT